MADRVATRYRRAVNREDPSTRSADITDYVSAKLCQAAIQDGLKPEAIFASVVDPVLEEILLGIRKGTVTSDESSHIKAVFLKGHVFCVLCVLILKLDQAAEDAFDELRDQAVESLVDLLFGKAPNESLSPAARVVVTRALAAGINRGLAALKEAAGHGAAIQGIQLLGLITCPDIEEHPDDDVYVYCLTPLATALLSDLLRQWIETRFKDRVSVAVGKSTREEPA